LGENFCYVARCVHLSTTVFVVAKGEGIGAVDWIILFLIFAGDQRRESRCVEAERGVADGWSDRHGGDWMGSFSYVKTHRNSVPG